MSPFALQDCPKCKTPRSGVRVRWCDRRASLHHQPLFPSVNHLLCPLEPDESLSRAGHMHHTCGTCGYEWTTRTADDKGDSSVRRAGKAS